MDADWQYAGEVAVDAGLIMVGDPCYAANKDHPIHDWGTFCNLLSGPSTQLKFAHGGNGLGVVVPSGHGDGIYPVYIKRDRGVVTELRVVFDGDEDDDQYDED